MQLLQSLSDLGFLRVLVFLQTDFIHMRRRARGFSLHCNLADFEGLLRLLRFFTRREQTPMSHLK
jgi:hypothetical protein